MPEATSRPRAEAKLTQGDPFFVRGKDSYRKCLELINLQRGRPCIVVTSDDRCIGVVSEGDIRRSLLQGETLDSPVSGLLKGFVSADSSTSAEKAARMMIEKSLELLPILSPDGFVNGVWVWESRVTPTIPVLILAGGKGSRLHPLTLTKPKPLIEVAGATLLDRAIENCLAHGFRKFFLSVNYLKEQVIGHLNERDKSLSIEFVEEETPLGTAGPVGLLPRSDRESVLVVNADVIHNVDLWRLAKQHEDNDEDLTVAVRLHQTTIPFGVVDVKGTEIVSVTEKPTISFPVNTGIYVLGPRVRQLVKRGKPLDMPDLIELAINKGLRVGAFLTEDYWLDVGTPENLARAEDEAGVWRGEQG